MIYHNQSPAGGVDIELLDSGKVRVTACGPHTCQDWDVTRADAIEMARAILRECDDA